MVLVHVGYLVLPVFGSVRSRGIVVFFFLIISITLTNTHTKKKRRNERANSNDNQPSPKQVSSPYSNTLHRVWHLGVCTLLSALFSQPFGIQTLHWVCCSGETSANISRG